MEFIAYQLGPKLDLEPAPASRDWQRNTPDGFAQRCLPMLIANQAGWILRNPYGFTAKYSGGTDASAIEIEMDEDRKHCVMSHFGSGILTWHIPYLFRTEPGVHLWVRGPANWPKDAVYPLEGIVETDWATQTFTMNWMITRTDHPVRFEAGEPICMVTPVRLADLEAMEPTVMPLSQAPIDTIKGQQAFRDSRLLFNVRLHERGSKESMRGWEKHYFKGKHHTDVPAEQQHRTKLHIRKFDEHE